MATAIRTANEKEELRLKQIFLNCFDDTLGFVNMFFEHHFIPENVIVAEKDGAVVGLLFLLPCAAGEKPCYYIYGVCVIPEERGKGIGSELLSAALGIAEKRGASVLLKPEDETLFPFYEKAGFSPCSHHNEMIFGNADSPAVLKPITAEEYYSLREEGFSGSSFISWDESAVSFALSHEIFFGGKPYKWVVGDKCGIVLFVRDGVKTIIKETTARGDELSAVAAAGMKLFSDEQVYYYAPADSGTPYAYGVGFSEPVYLNLMLD